MAHWPGDRGWNVVDSSYRMARRGHRPGRRAAVLAGLVLIDRYPIGLPAAPLANRPRGRRAALSWHGSVWDCWRLRVPPAWAKSCCFAASCSRPSPTGGVLPAGPWIGLVVASLVFGVCHSLCAAYAVLATVMGLAARRTLYLATGLAAAPRHHARGLRWPGACSTSCVDDWQPAHEKRRLGVGHTSRREITRLVLLPGRGRSCQSQPQQDFRHEQRLLLQQGVGQHTLTGTCSQTTRGTQRVAVYATCFGTHRLTWIVFV